jgi:hypothetical protein
MFKLFSHVRDINREITGQIIFISKDIIHVEYRRFKGDTETFVIEYLLSKESKSLKIIKPQVKDKFISQLTVGKLKDSLNRTTLDDNAIVMVEHDDSNNSFQNSVIIRSEPDLDSLFKQAFSANSTDKFFLIHINY